MEEFYTEYLLISYNIFVYTYMYVTILILKMTIYIVSSMLFLYNLVSVISAGALAFVVMEMCVQGHFTKISAFFKVFVQSIIASIYWKFYQTVTG